MKILNKIVDFIKSLISKVRKPFHIEVSVTSEKLGEKPVEKVEITVVKPVEQVEKPVEVPETSEKKVETVKKPVKTVKRRGRPRKVKAEWTIIDLKKSITAI